MSLSAFSPTERQLREATVASYFNARDLQAAAVTLERNGHRPQALALAIIGLEEVAKAVAYVRAAIQSDFPLATARGLRDHRTKHLVALKAAIAGIIVGDPAEGTTWEDGFRPTREHIVFFVLALCSDPLTGQTRLTDEEGIGHRMALVKEAALYVDLGLDSLRLPTTSGAELSAYLDQLSWLLDHCACLSDLARNETDWDEVVSGVRSVLAPKTPGPDSAVS